MCVAIRPVVPADKHYWEYVCNSLANMAENVLVCSREYYALCVNVTRNNNVMLWQDKMNLYAANAGMQVGVSDSFTIFQYCQLYYYSVVDVLTSLPVGAPAGIYRFSEYRMKLALANSCGRLLPQMMYCEAFQKLLEHDKGSAVSYIETLDVILSENLNMSQAAKHLFISRNSLMSRLERMNKVIDVDINDSDTRFALEYSIRLYKFSKS